MDLESTKYWNKTKRKTNTLYYHFYVEPKKKKKKKEKTKQNKKQYKWMPITKCKLTHRYREQTRSIG